MLIWFYDVCEGGWDLWTASSLSNILNLLEVPRINNALCGRAFTLRLILSIRVIHYFTFSISIPHRKNKHIGETFSFQAH